MSWQQIELLIIAMGTVGIRIHEFIQIVLKHHHE